MFCSFGRMQVVNRSKKGVNQDHLSKPSGSGADGDRTRDLRAASAALSQLSYGPQKIRQSIIALAGGVNAIKSRPRLLLPARLGSAAPEGFQAVVVAGFVGEDVDDHVEEV